jgi:SAM-dependent methyltransferase
VVRHFTRYGNDAKMHVNHRYLLARCRDAGASSVPVILDFGCGEGELVEAGRSYGLSVFGADVFYEGSSALPTVKAKGLLDHTIRTIRDGSIPFPPATFDAVVANQVFEHVENLEEVLQEIHRVLKPGGLLISLFPSLESIREGHCGVPCVHRFGRTSRLRYAYLLTWRFLGFGHNKQDKPVCQWCSVVFTWLDRFTHYRPRRQIRDAARQEFETVEFREDDYMRFRLQESKVRGLTPLLRIPGMRKLASWISIRFGSTVLVARKSATAATNAAAAA